MTGGYPLRLISSSSVFGGKCLSTSDVLYACHFLIEETPHYIKLRVLFKKDNS